MKRESPTLIIFAGANGSGKTSAARYLLPQRKILNFVNADEIARGLSPFDPTGQAMAAGRLALDRVRQLLSAGKSLAVETTLSGRHLERVIRSAKESGYRIEMYYVFCANVRINISRIKKRVKQGGHAVPEKDVRRRYLRSLRNWHSYNNLCDKMTLWDTTEDGLFLMAERSQINGCFVLFGDSGPFERFMKKVTEARRGHGR